MIVHSLFLVVGVLLLAGAVAALRHRLKFLKTAERAVGKVIRIDEKYDDEGTMYYPVYEIPAGKDETIIYGHHTSSSSRRWEIGEQEAFIFEQGKPETVRYLRYWALFWWPLSLLAVAVNLLIIGAGYFLLRGYFAG